MKFSVLISVYYKENPAYFDRAMQSIWTDQRLKPNEIVLVLDGKLTKELDEIVVKYQKIIDYKLVVIPLEKNVGLSKALEIGALVCQYDFIARMDSDDISMPERFFMQSKFIQSHPDIDVVGGFISEFEDDENEICGYRELPTNPEELAVFAKKRSPLNHVTVMMRKSTLLKVGNYEDFQGIEDYFLWGKMVVHGAKFANIPEYLVSVRAGRAMMLRRGGWKYALMEYKLQRRFYTIGFLSFFEMVRNICIRFPVRVMPKFLRAIMYKVFR